MNKPPRSRGRSPRERVWFFTINPWLQWYNCYISCLIGHDHSYKCYSDRWTTLVASDKLKVCNIDNDGSLWLWQIADAMPAHAWTYGRTQKDCQTFHITVPKCCLQQGDLLIQGANKESANGSQLVYSCDSSTCWTISDITKQMCGSNLSLFSLWNTFLHARDYKCPGEG